MWNPLLPIHHAVCTQQQLNATPDSCAVWKEQWYDKFENCAEEDILKNMGNQTVDGSHFEKYYGSQWGPSTLWLPIFFKISSFVFSRRKKFKKVWNNLRVSKWLQNCPLNFSFNLICNQHFSQCSAFLDYLISGQKKVSWEEKVFRSKEGILQDSMVLLPIKSVWNTPMMLENEQRSSVWIHSYVPKNGTYLVLAERISRLKNYPSDYIWFSDLF